MIDSVSQSCGPFQPIEVVLAANAFLEGRKVERKEGRKYDYESCIELLGNVNNSKSKPMHYIS